MSRLLSIFGAVLWMAATGNALARLWETQAQIEERLGQPIKATGYPHDRVFTYAFEDLKVEITFFNGVSDEETYQRRNGNAEFSNEEIRRLLELNSSGQPWQHKEEVNSWGIDTANGHAYAAYFPSFNHNRLYLYTDHAAGRALEDDSALRARTFKEQTLQAVVTIRQDNKATTLVARTGNLVLEICWNVEGYPQKPSLIPGETYAITIRDEQYVDRDTVIAFVSDRPHKSLEDLLRDSKTYLLVRIEKTGDVIFDRAICEVHHVRMSERMAEVEYGLRATPRDEAECEGNFPHYRDFILGGCVSSPDSPKKSSIFVCPECVAACRRMNF